jgi:glycerophosphoryl diester phosphodiesterase
VNGRAELFVEIKGDGIEDLVTAVLDGYRGPAAIHSFDRDLILRLATMGGGAEFRLGLLTEVPEADIATTMVRHHALDLWPHHTVVTRELVETVHAIGGRVIPWTVNHADEARRLAALDVDGLCSDDVTALPKALSS